MSPPALPSSAPLSGTDWLSPTLPTVPPQPSGADPLIGATIGDFVIRELLGAGGMGVVYAGEQPRIGKLVAIKVLRAEMAQDPAHVERLVLEARAVNAIRHRGIVDIFNLGQLSDGRPYVVMELLAGEPLSDLLRRRGALPVGEALALLEEILAALSAAHRAGVIHRDLKPSNIFLVAQPDGSRYVKLLDFGLAKRSAQPNGDTPQTRTDTFVGTPEYVAPEQARSRPVGPYTDLYSLGVVAFELLTGRRPFAGESAIDLIVAQLNAPPPTPSELVPAVPRELDALVLSLLEKDPARRPDADAVRASLSSIRRHVQGDALHDARTPAEPMKPGERMTLRLGTRFELGLSWVTPALSQLAEARPGRRVHLYFGDSPDLLRRVEDGALDCAITSARLASPSLRFSLLHEETYAFVASAELAAREPLRSPEDAPRHVLLDVHPDVPLFRYLRDARDAELWRFADVECLGTIAAIRHRLLESAGVAVLPTYFIAADLAAGRLVPLLPAVPLEKDFFRLVWRAGHPLDTELRQLATELRDLPLR